MNSKPAVEFNHASRTTHPEHTIAMQIIDVAAALIFRGGKLLITQRHIDAHLGGLWEFPGGKRETNETFEQCLARELREELGIEVSVREFIEGVTHAYPEKSVHLKFFRCEWRAHEPRALGCSAFKWVSARELGAHSFPAADERLLEKLVSDPKLWIGNNTPGETTEGLLTNPNPETIQQ